MVSELVLNAEQTRLLADAEGPVTVKDQSGRTVAVCKPVGTEGPSVLSLEDQKMIARRTQDDPRDFPTTAEVLAQLNSQAVR